MPTHGVHLPSATWQAVIVVLLALAALFLALKNRKGLAGIPGPFLASILPFDRISSAASGSQMLTHIKYHKKYGRLVRVGPNHVSVSDANSVEQIYGITSKFYKVCVLRS